MPELASRDRLQPSLLDRLTDDEPDKKVEPRERRGLSMRSLRQGVLRDLTWLLNTSNLESVHKNLGDYPLIDKSVINFGMPNIVGKSASGFRQSDLERSICQAIWDFEPRIMRTSVVVRDISARAGSNTSNIVCFELEGDLWALPFPEHLYLKTELDLETGSIRIFDNIGFR